MITYKTILHPAALDKAANYLRSLQSGSTPGAYLRARLQKSGGLNNSVSHFIELLMQTKKPQIFAESSVSGNGSDWNREELSILGDISVAVPVTVYDNGLHRYPEIHTPPFSATLLFTPGALLRNGRGEEPADWKEIVRAGAIDTDGYYQLYERRLLPALLHANETAARKNQKAFVTIPGLGCGQFAGQFQGQLGDHLKFALQEILTRHAEDLKHLQAIYFDPYLECKNERYEIGGISLMVRPLTMGNDDKPQLCHPTSYQEADDDFSGCDLFSVVAWDHVSWPGNDFFVGSRATDDGVKAAATNSMSVLCGIEGFYDKDLYQYRQPSKYRNWGEVVDENNLKLNVEKNICIQPPSIE
jgi:hypothetical protein